MKYKLVFIDIETVDVGLKDSGLNFKRENIKLLGVGVITPTFSKYYTEEDYFKGLTDLFRDPSNVFVGHNISYDLQGLSKFFDIAIEELNFMDTMLLHSYINENELKFSLDFLCEKYNLEEKKDSSKLFEEALKLGIKEKDTYKNLDKIPKEIVAEYCLQDLVATKSLFLKQIDELNKLYGLTLEEVVGLCTL